MIEYVVVHHTGVSRKKAPFQLKQTNDYHKKQFNLLSSMKIELPDITKPKGGKSLVDCYVGYTYMIEPDGQVIQTRKIGETQAAQIGFNKNTISICLTGNFDEEDPTKEQKSSFRKLIVQLMDNYSFTPDEIRPHRYFCGRKDGKLNYKTIQKMKSYKTCFGSRLPDDYFKNLL